MNIVLLNFNNTVDVSISRDGLFISALSLSETFLQEKKESPVKMIIYNILIFM